MIFSICNMCVSSSDCKGHHKLKKRVELYILQRLLQMQRWSKMMSSLGLRWWILLFMLICLLLLFHQFSGLRSPQPSSCRPSQPRREILTDEEEEEYEAWKEEQEKRRQRVKRFCKKETDWSETWLNDPNIHPLMFQYNTEFSLMGCLQPKVCRSSKFNLISSLSKVASTTWHQHFYCLESERRREELWLLPREGQADLLSAPSDPDLETLASSSVSFSMVRHPFERLVSAYQDKVVLRRIIMFLR